MGPSLVFLVTSHEYCPTTGLPGPALSRPYTPRLNPEKEQNMGASLVACQLSGFATLLPCYQKSLESAMHSQGTTLTNALFVHDQVQP